jgi:hypothetical protein
MIFSALEEVIWSPFIDVLPPDSGGSSSAINCDSWT